MQNIDSFLMMNSLGTGEIAGKKRLKNAVAPRCSCDHYTCLASVCAKPM